MTASTAPTASSAPAAGGAPVLTSEQIQGLLPHRYPMLLVDRIEVLEEERIVGIKNVTVNEPFFVGHFPDYPVMPGVLITEAMAQVAGVLVLVTLALLARYQRARRPANVAMLAATDGLDRLFSNNIPPIRLARDIGIAAVHRMPRLKRMFMRRAMGG